MAFVSNLWLKITDWFSDRSERSKLIRSFNQAARNSFTAGFVPVLLKSSISRGYKPYRHQFSNILGGSGFRIKAMSGRQLQREDIVNIGAVVLNDSVLVRRLVVLGFDTLEVHCDVGDHGCRWQLHDFIMIGQGGQDEH